MTENLKEILISKNQRTPIASSVEKQLIKIQGTLTSPIQLRGEGTKDPYYYAFIKSKGQSIDLPVVFRITATYGSLFKEKQGQYINYFKCENIVQGSKCRYGEPPYCRDCWKKLDQEVKNGLIKPHLKKSDELELTGNYSNSDKNIRESFTAYSYQILSEKRIRKKCLGCCDNFTCYKSKNYDYCPACEINGSRYANKDSPCSECDGSGLIKFKGQPPHNCKLCYLAWQETELSLNQKGRENIFAK